MLQCVAALALCCMTGPGLAAPGLAGSFFNNTTLAGPPALVRVDSTVDFNWASSSPDSAVNADNFSARWTGFVRVATTGNFTFQTVSDDGVRLTINGTRVIDNWTVHSPTTDTSAPVALTAGMDYPVTLEYFENLSGAVMRLNWKKPGDATFSVTPASDGTQGLDTAGSNPAPAPASPPAGTGLVGTYFNNITLTGPAVLVRTEAPIAYFWGTGSPDPAVNQSKFSARWVGVVRVDATGSYAFQTISNDGVRLSVNGARLIDNWTDHVATTDTATPITLTAGVDYPIVLDFYQNGGNAVMQLNWKKPGDAGFSAIPASNGLLGLSSGFALVAEYRFEEIAWNGTAGELKDSAGYTGGPFNGKAQGSPLPTPVWANPARTGSMGTCGYANLPGPYNNGGSFAVNGLPVSTAAGAQTTLAFWVYWDGTDNAIVASFNQYGLWFYNGGFGFNTNSSDIYGVASTGLAGGWHHVVAVFTNGSITSNRLYIDGVAQTLTQRFGSPSLGNAVVGSTIFIGGLVAAGTSFRFTGLIDEFKVYNGAASSPDVAAIYAQTHTCTIPLHHLEVRHSSGNGLTCTPSTLTVAACQDAACTTPYTGGVSGTLTATGAGMTTNWPTGAGFSIAAGSSTTTDGILVTTPGSVLVGITGASPAAANATTCNFGSPSCTFTAADAGLLFNVPNHRAEVSMAFTVTAVRKSDNSAACTPAFASVTKAVTFKCAYVNPASGTLPVRVGGAALNAGNSAAAACDAGGRAVSLAFDSTGKANTTVQYADVGSMTLTATYTGSGSDAGLLMTGSDGFVAAPYILSVSGPAAGNLTAGVAFSGSVTARNTAGNTAPNFGRESAAESATLSWVRTQPQGTGAVNGSFSGSVGAFSSGTANATNMTWTEVGRGELAAVLTSGSYLGSGLHVAGASNGMTSCAAQGAMCTLPTGVTALVYYGYGGWYNTRSGVTGSIACNNATFGDPAVGVGAKACSYVVTSGSSSASTGSVGPFIPHHFDVTVAPTCSSFTYAGQPFGASITARNAANNTTVNYDGSSNTSPNFAKAVTLTDAPTLGVGSFGSTGAVAATLFSAGVASSSAPTYTFTSKLTAAQSLRVRATDADAVSSVGFAEGMTALRSGRLRISNAFGSEKAALAVPVQAQYWSGNTWVANSADSCTTVPAAAVVRAGYLDNKGASTSGWTSSASAIVISAGAGTLTLSAPSPTTTGSLDFALNLGGTTTDQSCLAAHPASTAGALPWLRSQNGACASAWAADPSARATFGIYAPETRKTIHVREIF